MDTAKESLEGLNATKEALNYGLNRNKQKRIWASSHGKAQQPA